MPGCSTGSECTAAAAGSGAASCEDDYAALIAAAHIQLHAPIILIWDNLNVHYDGRDDRWTRFNARHGGRFHFVYTPKHASWMNQVEIWFSILHRRIIRYGDFGSTDHQKDEVEGFIRHWNKSEAHPFRWTWRTALETGTVLARRWLSGRSQ